MQCGPSLINEHRVDLFISFEEENDLLLRPHEDGGHGFQFLTQHLGGCHTRADKCAQGVLHFRFTGELLKGIFPSSRGLDQAPPGRT